jgi:hypothetical protein
VTEARERRRVGAWGRAWGGAKAKRWARRATGTGRTRRDAARVPPKAAREGAGALSGTAAPPRSSFRGATRNRADPAPPRSSSGVPGPSTPAPRSASARIGRRWPSSPSGSMRRSAWRTTPPHHMRPTHPARRAPAPLVPDRGDPAPRPPPACNPGAGPDGVPVPRRGRPRPRRSARAGADARRADGALRAAYDLVHDGALVTLLDAALADAGADADGWLSVCWRLTDLLGLAHAGAAVRCARRRRRRPPCAPTRVAAAARRARGGGRALAVALRAPVHGGPRACPTAAIGCGAAWRAVAVRRPAAHRSLRAALDAGLREHPRI